MEHHAKQWTPVGYEKITVSSTAIGLTESEYFTAGSGTTSGVEVAQRCVITVEAAAGIYARYCVDGTTATSTVGHLLENGDVLELDFIDELRNFNAIRTASTDVALHVTYYDCGRR